MSDVQTSNAGLVRNLNPDFNAVWVQVIMETIYRMSSDGSPLALLAQQGAEAANLIVAEKSANRSQGESSAGRNNQARRARSEVASSASPNRIYLSTMRAGASHITAIRENMVVIEMTSATSSKIGGASETEHQVHHHDS
jgi:hypothetical protein